MGKSTSCFKLITCGGRSKDEEDIDIPETKGSTEKHGWSFRNRSAQPRVLSSTVITESPSADKEKSKTAGVEFEPTADSNVPEKVSVPQSNDEIPHIPAHDNPKASEIVESKIDAKVEDPVVIVIQAAIRGLLARKELLKLKHVVKLQAAVRRHLVRRHAVGTLRCVQAMIKMQVLVRARLSKGGSHSGKMVWAHDKDYVGSGTLVVNSKQEKEKLAKSNVTCSSLEKLLSHRLARQLMESMPKTKPINVKCDPSKPDSAWKWLEIWMSFSSVNTKDSKKVGLIWDQEGREEANLGPQLDNGTHSEVFNDSNDSRSSTAESVLRSESEENLITYDVDSSKFQALETTSFSFQESFEQQWSENRSVSDVKETSEEVICFQDQGVQSGLDSQMLHNSQSRKPVAEDEQRKHSLKRSSSEQSDVEGKRFVFGSRKASNPAFVAAQSKFEELSSTANSGRSIGSTYQDNLVESPGERTSTVEDSVTRANGFRSVLVGGSECGTELSVSSTLDSPDRPEAGGPEYGHVLNNPVIGFDAPSPVKEGDVEVKDAPSITLAQTSQPVLGQYDDPDAFTGSINSEAEIVSSLLGTKSEENVPHLQGERNARTGGQAYRTSPEASPRSHVTVLESQGTPSSQLSVKPDGEKTGSNLKRKSLSSARKSPSNPNHDSGSRSSMENLPKDQKNGRRRNSFGSAGPEQSEQEARERSSNKSLPHFMQATESARAKVNSNNSPRASPDVEDRDIYVKKRHSLPGSNGRQGSPRIQRSMSQALQGAKGNERKWQR